MKHIRLKTSSRQPGYVYSVVVTDNWELPLEEHPSVVEHGDLYEVVDEDLPVLGDPTSCKLEFLIYVVTTTTTFGDLP